MTEYRDLDGEVYDLNDTGAEMAKWRRAQRIARVLATLSDGEIDSIYAGLLGRVNRDFEGPQRVGAALADAFDRMQSNLGAGKDPFFDSEEWLAVRYATLKKHGAKCMCCGTNAASGAIIQVDHIKPRSKFPELALDPDNLQVLCGRCNMGKRNIDSTDWRNVAPSRTPPAANPPRLDHYDPFAGKPNIQPRFVSTAETRARDAARQAVQS